MEPSIRVIQCLKLFKISFESLSFIRYPLESFIHVQVEFYWNRILQYIENIIPLQGNKNGYKNKSKSSFSLRGEIGVLECKKEQVGKERRNTYLDQSHPNPVYQLVTFFNNHERGYVLPSHHPITVIESGHDDTHAYQIYSKSQCVTRCSR